MTVLAAALAAFAATLIGGTFALRFRDHLHLILGFSAGAVAGVAFFDLLPESIRLGMPAHAASTIALFAALGFFSYLVLDRLILLHAHHDDHDGEDNASTTPEANAPRLRRGAFGALTLAAHSFLDGVAIGVGFQAGAAVGIVVVAAVLTHDFSDGINTVSLVLRDGISRGRAFRWLFVDAVAPVLGAASTLLFRLSGPDTGLVLAIFAGTFTYLSASDLIPESYHRHPRVLTTVMTLLGALVLYLVVRLV